MTIPPDLLRDIASESEHELAFALLWEELFPETLLIWNHFEPEWKGSLHGNSKVDFYNRPASVAIEIDGGLWTTNQHNGDSRIRDCRKRNLLRSLGVMVCEVCEPNINAEELAFINSAIIARNPKAREVTDDSLH